MLEQLRTGDRLALGGGVTLLLALFAPWYGVSSRVLATGDAFTDSLLDDFTRSMTVNAFRAFDRIDWLLAAIASGVVVLVALIALGMLDASLRKVVETVGTVAVFVILFRMVVRPAGLAFELRYGIVVALIGAIAISIGGMLNRRESG